MSLELQFAFYTLALVCAIVYFFRPDHRIAAVGLGSVTLPLFWAALEAM